MWPSSPVPLCCRRAWCADGLLLATHFVVPSAQVGITAECSAVWSRPQFEVVTDPSFILLYMWVLSRLWPMLSLMTTTCCHRSKKWNSSLSVRCSRAALMTVFLSWKVTLLSCCLPLAPSLANSSAFSFPGDHSGLVPTAGVLVCAARLREEIQFTSN